MSEPKPTYQTEPTPEPTLDELIAKDRQDRLTLCQAEIAAALRRHRCRIVATSRITDDGRIMAVMALDVDQ